MITSRRPVMSVVQAVGLLIVIAVFATPFLWMVLTAFKTQTEALEYPPRVLPGQWNLNNFAEAWASGPFLTNLVNTVIVTIAVLVLELLVIVPAAYAFAKLEFRFKGILFAIAMATLMIPTQLTFMPVYVMFSQWGLINSYWSLILPFAASAFGLFLLRQTFMQIPDSLIEAARLDNASTWTLVTRIMLPMARPTIVTILLLTFISRWNDYFWPLVMTTNDTVRPLSVGIAQLGQTEGLAEPQVLMAGNVLLILPIVVVYVFAQRAILNAFAYSNDK